MGYLNYIKKSIKLDIPMMYHDTFDKKDPDELRATGSQIYHGRQRQGKTLGMMYHFHRVKRRYPRTLTISNLTIFYRIELERRTIFKLFKVTLPVKVKLQEVEVKTEQDLLDITSSDAFKAGEWQKTHYMRYRSYETLIMLLRKARNGKWGTHFMIDEIHQYFHSHDSKSMPVWVAQIFSQQMKQYILVTGTVQKWENVIKALREQIQYLILCRRSGWRIHQTVVDPEDIVNEYGEMTAPIKKSGYFFMSKLVRESYDTLALVESGREIFGGDQTTNIMVNTTDKKKQSPIRRRATVR